MSTDVICDLACTLRGPRACTSISTIENILSPANHRVRVCIVSTFYHLMQSRTFCYDMNPPGLCAPICAGGARRIALCADKRFFNAHAPNTIHHLSIYVTCALYALSLSRSHVIMNIRSRACIQTIKHIGKLSHKT